MEGGSVKECFSNGTGIYPDGQASLASWILPPSTHTPFLTLSSHSPKSLSQSLALFSTSELCTLASSIFF